MQTRIQKWGNSLGLRIPKSFAEETGVSAGSEVSLTVVDGGLVVRPTRVRKYALADLLQGVNRRNLHAEVDSSGPVGGEAW